MRRAEKEDPHGGQYLDRVLAEAHDSYTKRNPKSLEAHLAAHSSLPGGNTRTVLHVNPFPLTWKSGQGARLTSLDDDVYIDLLGEFSAGIFGHSDARIAEAVKSALLKGWNYGGNSAVEKQFAAMFCQRFSPAGIELVRFTNSGTEANTTCLAAAVALTGRKKILVFSGGYHGSTLVFPKALMKGELNIPSMNLPHEFVYAPYNNIEETKNAVAHINANSELAAVLVEAVQGSGGCRPATKEFMLYLRTLATETGALLIIDEVMSSRLGVSGYSATMDIRGDLVTFGKYLGGGMTFGAFGGRRDLMEKFDPAKNMLFHPGTYNNNVVSMHAGIEGLRIFNEREVLRLNGLGEELKRRVQKFFIEEGLYPESITDPSTDLIEIDSLGSDDTMREGDGQTLLQPPKMFITGKGSMLNVRFSGPDSQTWQALFYHHNLANGINIAARGYTPLNLCLSEEDIKKYISVIKAFVIRHRTELLRVGN